MTELDTSPTSVSPRSRLLYLGIREGILAMLRAFDRYFDVKPLDAKRGR